MPIQPDPRFFDIGGAFLQGQQQAQEGQRRNAMLDLEQRQQGMYEDRFAMQQDEYERNIAAREQEAAQRQARAPQFAQLFVENGVSPEVAEMLAESDGAEELAQEFLMKREQAMPASYQEHVLSQQDPAYAAFMAQKNAPKSAEDVKPALQEITMPDGSIQKMWLRPGETEGPRVGAPAFPRQTQISPKDLVTARNKLNVITLARQQLKNISSKFDAIKGSSSAGKLQGWVPSPKGEAFDKSIDLMRSTLTSLTKVPGIGAMSDYETRLDQAKFPSRGDYENVTADNIAQLDAMLNAIEVGYSDLISQGPVQAGNEAPASGGKRIAFDKNGRRIP